MKIITTTGFYGTGSSAITDLFSEMDNVCVRGDYEFRIFCDPDGLSDLEYNLIQNPNRHNTSNAIKRYRKQAEFLNGGKIIKRYNKFFGDSFMEVTLKYLNDISEFTYTGSWYFDVYERGPVFWFTSRSYSRIRRTLDKLFSGRREKEYSLIPAEEMAYAGTFSEERFLKATKEYTDALTAKFNDRNLEYVMLDQLVPPTNLARYSRYFSDICIFVLDRDPRDIFLLEKERWRGRVAPVYDVEIFIRWYNWTRGQFELFELPENAARIQFEDLIYKYEETVSRILQKAGIDRRHHAHPFIALDPEISVKNTRLWETYPEYKDEMKVIEKKLQKYCYAYDSL